MSDPLQEATRRYLDYERVEQHRRHIEQLVEAKNEAQLDKLLGRRLTFGTAGLRGRMGPGFSQMNELVVIQTSQGLASYMVESLGEQQCKERGVIIGHDARHNSSRFAKLAALAFLQKAIPVYYCDEIVPTPFVALGVKHFGCLVGVMVTASHNPKQDNGYKVFWSNGAQILSPHDKNIQAHIERPENQAPWARAWCHEALASEWRDLFYHIQLSLTEAYFDYVQQSLVGQRRHFNEKSAVRIAYTTMHGVGHSYLSRALALAGFGEHMVAVEAQRRPDPDFPTLELPNPEERGALELAFETARESGSNLVLALDPDADRCGAALYAPERGYKRVLTGDEIGALLGWWLWHCHQQPAPTAAKLGKRAHEDDSDEDQQGEGRPAGADEEPASGPWPAGAGAPRPGDCYMLSTAVSSKFLSSMARKEGFRFVETLTGFKHMANRADQLMRQRPAKCVLFAYEEAIGYMVSPRLLDKDGISAAVQLAQCAAHLGQVERRDLEQQLDWLYARYGYHCSLNSYYLSPEPAVSRRIFRELQAELPESFVYEREQFRVTRVRDLNSGLDSGTASGRPELPVSADSFMVTFFVQDDITLTIRTSGTEPKIKYYSEIVVGLPQGDAAQRAQVKLQARARLGRLVAAALERCLRPGRHNLRPAGQ